jgi:hypothetical protein
MIKNNKKFLSICILFFNIGNIFCVKNIEQETEANKIAELKSAIQIMNAHLEKLEASQEKILKESIQQKECISDKKNASMNAHLEKLEASQEKILKESIQQKECISDKKNASMNTNQGVLASIKQNMLALKQSIHDHMISPITNKIQHLEESISDLKEIEKNKSSF